MNREPVIEGEVVEMQPLPMPTRGAIVPRTAPLAPAPIDLELREIADNCWEALPDHSKTPQNWGKLSSAVESRDVPGLMRMVEKVEAAYGIQVYNQHTTINANTYNIYVDNSDRSVRTDNRQNYGNRHRTEQRPEESDVNWWPPAVVCIIALLGLLRS